MAPPILSYENLGLHQGEGWLFRGIDIHVAPRDRLALIGRNGAGKTTLLKCLAGTIDTDLGSRTIVPGTRVVLLEQDPVMTACSTLEEWVLGGEGAPQPHEAAELRLDSRAARERLDWQPVWSAAQAIERTARWYRQFAADGRIDTLGDLHAYAADARHAGRAWAT